MTARECLTSDDPKAVGRFYDELKDKGRLGERAFHMLRAHRNVSRVRHYDDEKYMKFLRGRAVYAVGELMSFIGVDKDESEVDKVLVVVPQFENGKDELAPVTFKRDRAGEWKSTKQNERIIVKFCDTVMRG